MLGELPLPPGEIINGRIYRRDGSFVHAITNGKEGNEYVGAVAPALSFVGRKSAAVVRTTEETQYVRFYTPGQTGAVGSWIAGTNAVRGLTAKQVKDVLALPFMPTAYTFVRVPAGTCLLAAHGAAILGHFPADPPDIPAPGPWGHGGTPQYYIVGQSNKAHCEDPQYLPNDDYVNQQDMGKRALAYRPLAGRGNVGKVASALDHAPELPALFSDMDGIYNSLDLLNIGDPGPLRSALVQLGGEAYADVSSVEIAGGWMFLNVLRDQMRLGRQAAGGNGLSSLAAGTIGAGELRFWLGGYGSAGRISGNGNTHDLDFGLGGPVAGVDYQVSRDLRLGGAIAYSRGSFSVDGLSSNGHLNTYSGALYASYAPGRFYVDAALGYARSDAKLTRDIVFPGVTRAATGKPSSDAFLSNVELGYHFDLGERTIWTPIAGLQAIVIDQEGLKESGAGAINLHIESEVTTSIRSLLGGELKHRFLLNQETPLDFVIRAGWMHDFADTSRTITASFDGLAGAAFTIDGAKPARDSAVVGAGLSVPVNAGHSMDVFARYDGIISNASDTHAGTIGFRLTF